MKEIWIDKPIGNSGWEGITPESIRKALAEIQDDEEIRLVVNSPGGSVIDAFAIYNMLLDIKDRLIAVVIGAAWSAASFIPMAAKRIVTRPASSWMIHDAWGVTIGNAQDHLKAAEALDKLSDTIAGIYAQKTGKSQEEMRKLMLEETWLDPQEALQIGLVDEVDDGGESADLPEAFKKFAQQAGFRNFQSFFARFERLRAAGKENAAAMVTAAPVKPAAREEQPTMEAQNTVAVPPTVASEQAPAGQAQAIVQPTEKIVVPEPAKPVAAGIRAEPDTLQAHLDGKKPKERVQFLRAEWQQLRKSFPLMPQAYTDTSGGALVPTMLSSVVVTVLQDALAPLRSFTLSVEPQRRLGRNTLQTVKVPTGGTGVINPTNFFDTTNFAATVTNVAVTPAHLVVGWELSNADLQNGYSIEYAARLKAAELATLIFSRINPLLISTNFANPLVKSFAAWAASDMKTLWSRLAKSPLKYAILDPEYFKVLLPDNALNFNPLEDEAGIPGWDGIFYHTYWTGAGANVRGFACAPQAIAVAAGLPETAEQVRASFVASQVVQLDRLGIEVEQNIAASLSTRSLWATLEVMLGAAVADGSAGVLVTTA